MYHLAAAVGVPRIVADPLGSLHTNVAGAANVLAACARHQRKVLVASSSEVYGRANSGILSEDDDRVLGPPTVRRWSYAVAKALDEHLALAYADDGLPMAIVRYFNSYGPRANARENASVVGAFIRQALRDDPLRVQGDGSQRRCFTFVADTVRGTELAATLPRAEGNIFNIGATEETSILTLAQMVIAATDSSSPIEFVPYAAVHGDKFEDVARRVPDIGRGVRDLGLGAHGLAERGVGTNCRMVEGNGCSRGLTIHSATSRRESRPDVRESWSSGSGMPGFPSQLPAPKRASRLSGSTPTRSCAGPSTTG